MNSDNDWIANESFNAYWGIDLNMLLEDPKIGPGALIGTNYWLSPRFAIFGEVGVNLFVESDGGNPTLGLHNSGVGLKIAF
ncbi:hypothetical protein [Fodinibius sp.]|uniref:hypothetical protein n=1 Tax=Fodinibius sp. TaxID=1872440 RepID=UPI002ACD6179|nr:hypothetical protein [Fodinibius sp.]MDZ7658934.1 hypothetical protein [Fodinibius sp.]